MLVSPEYRIKTTALAEETLDQLREVRAHFSGEQQLAMLDTVSNHIRAEWIDLDIDATMGTMSPHPRARVFGASGARPGLDGYQAIRENYLRQFKHGQNGGGIEIQRILIDEDAIFLQGNIVHTLAVAASGWPALADAPVEAGRTAIVRKSAALVLPFEEGKVAAEFCYYNDAYTAADIDYLD